MNWWVMFWIWVPLCFSACFLVVTCLCMAAKRGDEMAGRIEERLAPYTVDGDQRLIDKRFDEIVRGL